jgi:hypothetical protein
MALFILHNFMLSLDDEWTHSRREIRKVQKNENAAYEALKTSEWAAGRLVNSEVNPVTEAAIKKDGKLKRKYVMEELLKWKGRVRGGPTRRDTSSDDSTNFSDESEDEW